MQLNITIEQPDKKLALFGSADRYLRMIRDTFGIQVVGRDVEIHLTGDREQVGKAAAVLEQLQRTLRRQDWLSVEDVGQAIGRAADDHRQPNPDEIDVYAKARPVRPKTPGQRTYIDAILHHDLTFCIGPAGTGKTYLAVAAAANLLKHGRAKRIILARPAVEAGERLGFLPGDLQAKVNPYLRPLFDALHDMMEPEQVQRYMQNDIIEIVPLAYMRGRTLNQAVIILDEGQNTTVPQMKMFLTRMGNGSKIMVTGDVTQVDLPRQMRSGLVDAVHRLRDLDRIAIIYLDEHDIVRHPLVQLIVRAYEDEKPRKKN